MWWSPHATLRMDTPRRWTTSRGASESCTSPWPSMPPSPQPKVKSRPSSATDGNSGVMRGEEVPAPGTDAAAHPLLRRWRRDRRRR